MSDIKYTRDHEWLRMETDGSITVGISNFAQEQLGDVVYVDLPAPGKGISTGDDMATVESVKTAGEIKAPVSGEVISINERLADEPELVNADPLGDGWFFTMTVSDPGELEEFMTEEDYETYVGSL